MRPHSFIGHISPGGVGRAPSTIRSPYAQLTRFYVAVQALLAIAVSVAAAAQRDALSLSRGALQLSSVLALLPVTAPATSHGAPAVAAFAAAIAMVVDAVLRTLAALHQVVHAGAALRSTPLYVALSAAEAVIAAGTFAVIAPSARHSLILRRAFLMKSRFPFRKTSTSHVLRDLSANATDLCLLVLFLNATGCATARGADLIAAFGAPNAAWPAMGHATASIFFTCLVFEPAKRIAYVLLQAVPDEVASSLATKLQSISKVDGVLAVHNVHFWEETLGVCIGQLSLTIAHGAKPSMVRRAVTDILGDDVSQLTIQVEEAAIGMYSDVRRHHGDEVMLLSPSHTSPGIQPISPVRAPSFT
jgi:Co/Zn/Cd efflux system component